LLDESASCLLLLPALGCLHMTEHSLSLARISYTYDVTIY
jgi:hypothetical protein